VTVIDVAELVKRSLDLNLTAEENIRLRAVLYGLYPLRPLYRLMPRGYRQQVRDLADMLGITGVLSRPARTLSGGTRRRLEIIRALMHAPRVLFLDEPTAGLDPESRRSLWAYLRQIRAARGTTVFLTTHYLEEAEAADAVCVMRAGRVIERGSPAEVKGRQATSTLEDAYLLLLERPADEWPWRHGPPARAVGDHRHRPARCDQTAPRPATADRQPGLPGHADRRARQRAAVHRGPGDRPERGHPGVHRRARRDALPVGSGRHDLHRRGPGE
jgi:ABC-type Na+ transport system ATPase subunit NatA